MFWNTTKAQVRDELPRILEHHQLFRKENSRPWKYQLVHEITDEDFDRMLQFAEWILTQRNPHAFARKIVFFG